MMDLPRHTVSDSAELHQKLAAMVGQEGITVQ